MGRGLIIKVFTFIAVIVIALGLYKVLIDVNNTDSAIYKVAEGIQKPTASYYYKYVLRPNLDKDIDTLATDNFNGSYSNWLTQEDYEPSKLDDGTWSNTIANAGVKAYEGDWY